MAPSITIASSPIVGDATHRYSVPGGSQGTWLAARPNALSSAPILRNRAFATHYGGGARPSAARLAGQSHRRIAAVVLDSDMTMRFGAVRLLAFELLLPPPGFSTRRVSASELVAFVDLVWGPGIFISNHLGVLPFACAAAVTRDGELLPIRCSVFGCSHLQPVFNHPPPMLSIAYGFVALSARSRYSSAFVRNSSAFDAMAESPITPVNG
jgi:hypothetical protein